VKRESKPTRKGTKTDLPADPRRLALSVINRLESEDQILDLILDDSAVQIGKLSKPDRNLFNELVFGVLRWRGRLDWIIGHFSKTPLKRIEPKVLNILRMGAYQIIYLTRIPDSAAVNTSVELAKSDAPRWVTGFVNGLLRGISRDHLSVTLPDPEKNPAAAMAVEKAFPQWLIRRWLDRFGTQGTSTRCDAVNTIPPISVRTNTLKTTRKQLLERLNSHVESIRETAISPDGIVFRNPKLSIPSMKPFKEGLFQVQDEAAQLVSLLLDPLPGESVLDACAGLGGKTGHLAQLMRNQGTLLATDKDEQKLRKLESEMKRLGVSIVKTCLHDFKKPLNEKHSGRFHRVLLDAPCSGIGVLRRNPDAKWSITEKDIERNRGRQVELLSAVSGLVLPGGVLVYSVCSTEPEETETVVDAFISDNGEFAVDKDFSGFSEPVRSIVNQDGYLITYPYRHEMDGFFCVRFKRTNRLDASMSYFH